MLIFMSQVCRLTIRQTDVLGEYMLYSSRKVGDSVVRLAIPYRQAREAARIAEMSLAVAASWGVFFAVAIFLLTRHFCRRIASDGRGTEWRAAHLRRS